MHKATKNKSDQNNNQANISNKEIKRMNNNILNAITQILFNKISSSLAKQIFNKDNILSTKSDMPTSAQLKFWNNVFSL